MTRKGAYYLGFLKILKSRLSFSPHKGRKEYLTILNAIPATITQKFDNLASSFRSDLVLKPIEEAKRSACGLRLGYELENIVKKLKPEIVWELGTNVGVGTWHLLNYLPQNGSLSTVDINLQVISLAQLALQKSLPNQYSKLVFYNMKVEDFVKSKLSQGVQPDLLVIDAGHDTKTLLSVINPLVSSWHSNSIWVFDDIRHSRDMWEGWNIAIKMIKGRPIDRGSYGMILGQHASTRYLAS